jgi:hypothetical protein
MRNAAATVTISDQLEIKISPIDPGLPGVVVRLNRVSAQHICSALLEYSGAATKSYGRGRETTVAAYDTTDRAPAAPRSSPIVRVGPARRTVKV